MSRNSIDARRKTTLHLPQAPAHDRRPLEIDRTLEPKPGNGTVWEGLVRSGALPIAEQPGRIPIHPQLAAMASAKEQLAGVALLPNENAAHNLRVWQQNIAARAPNGAFAIELSDGKGPTAFTVKTSVTDAAGITHTSAGLLERMTKLAFGHAMLTNEGWGAASTSVGFIDDREWSAFEKFYTERGPGLPRLSGSAFPVWVKDGSDIGGHVLFVVPAQAASKAGNVALDMRDSMGIRDLEGDGASAALAVARAQQELKGKSVDDDTLRAVWHMLVHSDVSDARVSALLDDVAEQLNARRDARIKSFEGALASDPALLKAMADPTVFGAVVDERRLSSSNNHNADYLVLAAVCEHAREKSPASRKKLVRTLATDMVELRGQREYAERKLRARAAIQQGGDRWLDSLKHAARRDIAAMGFHRASDHGWKPADPETKAALDATVARGVNNEAFADWLCGMLDRVGTRMAASLDPVIQERWQRRELDPQIVREVAYEDAQRLGFSGLYTISPDAGYVSTVTFYEPIAAGKLIDDAFFSVDTGVIGLHGRDVHVLTWVYLAEGEPRAVQLYKDIGRAYVDDPKGMVEKSPFYNLFDSQGSGLMSPATFTQLTAPFLGSQ